MALAVALASCSPGGGGAPAATSAVATPASLSPQPTNCEAAFIARVTKDLEIRFSAPAFAERAGYERYTAEDSDGIITYTNLRWYNDDPRHPTQLWYDANGRLIGVDYTMRVVNRRQRPDVWGLQSGRWVHFIAHVHYVVRNPDGTTRYGSLFNSQYAKAGGDPKHPTALPLVRAGVAKAPGDVKLVFLLPEIWITSFWLIPNPNGAFAPSNPNVVPSKGTHQNTHPMT